MVFQAWQKTKNFLLSIPIGTRTLLILFVLVFLAGKVFSLLGHPLYPYFALQSDVFWKNPWKLFTDPFFHADFSILLLNSFCLYNCTPAEKQLGSKRFILWMILAVILCEATSLFLGWTLHLSSAHLGSMTMGLFAMTLMARVWSHRKILFWAIPHPVSAKTTFYLLIGISLLTVAHRSGWFYLLPFLPAIGVGSVAPLHRTSSWIDKNQLSPKIQQTNVPSAKTFSPKLWN